MKIAFIGQKGMPALAGSVEKHVEKLATSLAAQGHEVAVYVRARSTPRTLHEFEGVKLVHVPCLPIKHCEAITHAFCATLHALFSSYDVIHYQSIGAGIWSVVPRLLKPKCRVVTTIIPSGVEATHEAGTEALNRFGLRPRRYLLAVHPLAPQEGTHYLIKAFKELEDTNRLPNNFKLVIVGDHAEGEEYARFLSHLVEHRPNILLVGEQTGPALETLYSHAYLYVQPSEHEGLSQTLLKAMGQGLMPLVSDIEAHHEAVANTGIFFPVKDVDGLKNELAYFVNREDEVLALGQAAKERVRSLYSWDAVAERTLEVYREAQSTHNLKEPYAHVRGK